MSRTYSKHLARGERSKRGGRSRPESNEGLRQRPLKSTKQRRPNQRTALRREYL